MSLFGQQLWIGVLAVTFFVQPVRADSLAARVIVVANRMDSDSLRLAHYYAAQRQIPEENIFSFAMSSAETIGWPEFVATIWQPLQDELVKKKWIEATRSRLLDAAGRKKYAIDGHRISYLVICRGVPLRVGHDPALLDGPTATALQEQFRTNQAAVDSELALLATNRPAINGFADNPLFQNEHPSALDLNAMIKVSRLDGPTAADAQGLVDHAILAEREGLMGRAYVDLGGVHPDGDRWLENVGAQIERLGFDLDVDHAPETFPSTARFDAPALYFGWYAAQLNGPMALPEFRFPPGAVAVHIHSFSATTLRSTTEGWSGPLIARGVTATVGNVFEPYLQLTRRPDLLLSALVRGENFGDAAAYACPALSWQTIALGDPLYRPFAVPLSAQLSQKENPASAYAELRRARLLEHANKSVEALDALRTSWDSSPEPVLGLALANRLEEKNEFSAAAEILDRSTSQIGRDESLKVDRWALWFAVADHLAADGNPSVAVKVFQKLFAANLPVELHSAWLKKAREAATAAHDATHVQSWSEAPSAAVTLPPK